MTQTKISKAFQTTISAEEMVEDVDALAGSLGRGKGKHSMEEIRMAARKGITKAGSIKPRPKNRRVDA